MTPDDNHDRDLDEVRQGTPGRRVTGDTTAGHGDRHLTRSDRDDKPNPDANESSYPGPLRHDNSAVRNGGIHIELLAQPPSLTPGAARALLRILLRAARERGVLPPEPDHQHHRPERSP
jgi:hypothetical protein